MTIETPSITAEHNRAVWRPHVTVATVAPNGNGGFLLVEESIRGQIVLNQPAGHLEPGESLQAAAIRETLEETGWDVELEALLSIQQWSNDESEHFVRFTFAARPLHYHRDHPLDSGILRAVWLSRDEIAAAIGRLRSPMVLASVDDWLSAQRLPIDSIRYL